MMGPSLINLTVSVDVKHNVYLLMMVMVVYLLMMM